MRLNKFISSAGICSRRKAEELILQGRIQVNKNVVIDLATVIDPEKDNVFLDGEKINVQKFVYYVLNKPKGYITSTADEKNRPVVTDILRSSYKIFPIGRLDFNSYGVLILTNDGDFADLLMHPKHKVERVYLVKLDKDVEEEHLERLIKGIVLEGKKAKFVAGRFIRKKDKRLVEVTAVEGRNHFVKNMFSAFGYKVLSLERVSYAGITANVRIGDYRNLSKEEIQLIKNKYAK